MAGAWVQFAKTGNPNAPGLPQWPAYRSPEYLILDYGDDIAVRADVHGAQVEFFAPIVEKTRRQEAEFERR